LGEEVLREASNGEEVVPKDDSGLVLFVPKEKLLLLLLVLLEVKLPVPEKEDRRTYRALLEDVAVAVAAIDKAMAAERAVALSPLAFPVT